MINDAEKKTDNKMIQSAAKQEDGLIMQSKGYSRIHIKNHGENFRYDLETENARIIELYDNWKNSPAESQSDNYEKYVIALCDTLENLIKSHIKFYKFTYGQTEYEDLIASGNVAIMEKIASYDPRRSMPSSFFGPKIDELLRICNRSGSPLSNHYIAMGKTLKDAAKKAGYSSLFDPEVTPELLQILTGISLRTIVNTLDQINIKIDSIDDDNFVEPTEYTQTPEQICVRDENRKFLNEALNSLTEYERFIFMKACVEVERDKKGIEKHMSIRRLCSILSEPDAMEHFHLPKKPDNNSVAKDIELARRKLAHYAGMKERFSYHPKSSNPYLPYEQADMDEIESAILADIQPL